jgi:hypothetical protein
VSRALLTAFTALTLATAAQASPVVHDTSAEFSITRTQGLQGNGAAVPTARSNPDNMFDAAGPTTFYSLGLGGTLTLTILPTSNRIISGFSVERTNLPGTDHPEVARVFLGVNGANFVLVGELRNSHAGAGVTIATGSPATLAFDGAAGPNNEARSLFSITNINGNFNTIRFEDASRNMARTNDGFDIAELRLTSEPVGGTPDPAVVPAPMALSLFALGLAGLVALRRRG